MVYREYISSLCVNNHTHTQTETEREREKRERKEKERKAPAHTREERVVVVSSSPKTQAALLFKKKGQNPKLIFSRVRKNFSPFSSSKKGQFSKIILIF